MWYIDPKSADAQAVLAYYATLGMTPPERTIDSIVVQKDGVSYHFSQWIWLSPKDGSEIEVDVALSVFWPGETQLKLATAGFPIPMPVHPSAPIAGIMSTAIPVSGIIVAPKPFPAGTVIGAAQKQKVKGVISVGDTFDNLSGSSHVIGDKLEDPVTKIVYELTGVLFNEQWTVISIPSESPAS